MAVFSSSPLLELSGYLRSSRFPDYRALVEQERGQIFENTVFDVGSPRNVLSNYLSVRKSLIIQWNYFLRGSLRLRRNWP